MEGQFIFLDDIRTPRGTKHITIPQYPWTITRNYKEFVRAVSNYYELTGKAPTFICFDHDLCDHSYVNAPDYANPNVITGWHCAKWLIEFCKRKNLKFPDYLVHSLNPNGKKNIISIIDEFIKSSS